MGSSYLAATASASIRASSPRASRQHCAVEPHSADNPRGSCRRRDRHAQVQPPVHWVEPRIRNRAPRRDQCLAPARLRCRLHFPEWARFADPGADQRATSWWLPGYRGEGSRLVHSDARSVALDNHTGGTVELADEGPLLIDNLRVAGESRLIRARPGFRADRSNRGTDPRTSVRRQQAVFMLDRKNLTLDGDRPGRKRRTICPAIKRPFSHARGANLTLKNCSITILNNRTIRVTVVRTTHSGRLSQPTRIRLERVAGARRVDHRASIWLAVRRTWCYGIPWFWAVPGPLVRVTDTATPLRSAIIFRHSLLAGPGPIVELIKALHAPTVQDSADPGVWLGVGPACKCGIAIASVISSIDLGASHPKQIDWAGERNLYAGWKGFLREGRTTP